MLVSAIRAWPLPKTIVFRVGSPLKLLLLVWAFLQISCVVFPLDLNTTEYAQTLETKENRNHFRFTASLCESRKIISVYHLTTS